VRLNRESRVLGDTNELVVFVPGRSRRHGGSSLPPRRFGGAADAGADRQGIPGRCGRRAAQALTINVWRKPKGCDAGRILRLMNEMGDLADGDLTVRATVTEDITAPSPTR
jgi:hypothetical protein